MTFATPAVLYTQGSGSRAESVEVPTYSNRNPASQDRSYPIGKRWINTVSNSVFTLTSMNTFQGISSAVWTPLAGGLFTITDAGVAGPLVNGSITVSSPTCTTNSIVLVSVENLSSTFSISSVLGGNGSFTISSGDIGDMSTFYYIVVN